MTADKLSMEQYTMEDVEEKQCGKLVALKSFNLDDDNLEEIVRKVCEKVFCVLVKADITKNEVEIEIDYLDNKQPFSLTTSLSLSPSYSSYYKGKKRNIEEGDQLMEYLV